MMYDSDICRYSVYVYIMVHKICFFHVRYLRSCITVFDQRICIEIYL